MASVVTHLADLRASTAGMVSGFDAEQWTDDDMRAPSLLPDWTRGHVLTHISRNADGITRCLAGALRGEMVPRYDSWDARCAAIEQGAVRSAAELIADVRDSADRLDVVLSGVAEADGWDLPTPDHPARHWVEARWREVEVHRVDAAGSYAAADWAPPFIGYLLPELAGAVGGRTDAGLHIEVTESKDPELVGRSWDAGSGDLIDVRGPDWALLAWLIGRPLPETAVLSATPLLGRWM